MQPRPARRVRRPVRSALALKVWFGFGSVMLLTALTTLVVATQLHGPWAAAALVLGAMAAATAAMLARWLLRNLVGPLAAATQAAASIKEGDLTARVDEGRGRVLQSLMTSLHEVQERLFGVVTGVRTGTGNVAVNASLIARYNDTLEERTMAQSASVQNTAASMEELTAAVRQGAGTTREAHTLVRAASERAAQGDRVMGEVVETMEAIRAGSQNIREIIGVIDAIAFQTNLLALNAAVEAARAGDQGRGFAVVAAEVRTLAKRCAEAAREIRELIVASVGEVDSGGERVQQAREAMASIVASVRQVSGLIGQIDASTQEQNSGILTMSEAVAKIDKATQGNNRLVADAARTSAELSDRAAGLMNVVSLFRLGDREHGSDQDALTLVASGCEYLRAHGRQALLDEVNRLDFGQFIHRDLYLMVLDENTVFVAHGNNPGRVGTGPEVRDPAGKPFARELVRVGREQG
jgi:methyl-accepting chemotaxis protein